MRIGFISQWYPPEPAYVPRDIAEGLASRGHDVHVVTGFPNYPDGRVVEGYRIRPYRKDVLGPHLTVHRAPLIPSHNARAIPRMLNYLSFAAGAAAVVAARVPLPDVWLVYSSPVTAALPTTVLTKRAPVVSLVQDLWPDSVTESAMLSPRMNALATRVLRPISNMAYRRSDVVGVISPGMADVLVGRGVPEDRIHFTPNWTSDDHILQVSPTEIDRGVLGLPAGFLFLYAGNLGDLQSLDAVVDAFSIVPDVQFALVGDGIARQRLQSRAAMRGARNIHFIPRKSRQEVGAYLAAADVQLVSLMDVPLLRVTMPSKVQTSLSTGRPTLVCAVGDAADLVEQAGAGMSAPPGDVDAIAATIRRLAELPLEALREMGAAGRARYVAEFSPEAGVTRLETVLTGVESRRNGS